MKQTERRRHPRAAANLSMRLSIGPDIVETRIRNLSCSGISFLLPMQLQPMSRVQIALELPHDRGADAFSIAGVVVRCEPIAANPAAAPARLGVAAFEAAIFFDELSDRARAQISRFVDESCA